MNKNMKKSHTELLQGLVSAGMKERYGNELEPKQINANTMVCSTAPVRMLLEMKQIEEAGFIDYYLMAFWIFNIQARAAGIEVWARGAVSSSVVCYCLGLTEVDPIKYGLHSARFVNEDLPKFQFDIEASRFDEFMKKAEEILAENAEDYDIPAIRECLFKDLKPASYLSKKKERPLPEDLEDEFARYALYFPQTMDLFTAYVNRYPKCKVLIYQEQMFDILREVFHVGGIKANHIRLSIQRGDTEQIEAYKQEVFEASDLSTEEKEKAWQRLTSNPKAFLKAHAVSQVLASYKFDMGEGFIKKWKEVREYNEGLAGVKDADGKWGFIDKTGKLVIPCQWKKALFFSEDLAGVQDDNEKWGFIDKTGKVALPFVWSNVQWFRNGRVRVQTVLGGGWHDIDREGNDVQ